MDSIAWIILIILYLSFVVVIYLTFVEVGARD